MSTYAATTQTAPTAGDAAPHEVAAVYDKISRRIVPLLFACMLLNFVDRLNVGFAQLQMKTSLGFSDAVYGFGAAIFFVGYVIFEVPSNLLMKRIGARLTLTRIMVLWGLASAATMLVTTPFQFYTARFLLGVAEAGFAPGILLYLTYWYPPDRRARVMSIIVTAQLVSTFVTSPVSGAILKHLHGWHGFDGWQWMFLLEGMPTVLLGLVVWRLLPDRPLDAKWLTPAERAIVQAGVARQHATGESGRHPLFAVMRDPVVYLLAFCCFVSSCGGYFLAFWTPTIIRELGVADLQMVGIYAVLPNAFAIVAMVLYGRHSDYRNEQRLHWAVAAVTGAVGFIALAVAIHASLLWTLVAIAVGGSALMSCTPIFFATMTRYLSRENAPAGIAYISTLYSLAGLSPALVGVIKTRTGSLQPAIFLIAMLFVVAAATMVFGMRKPLQGK